MKKDLFVGIALLSIVLLLAGCVSKTPAAHATLAESVSARQPVAKTLPVSGQIDKSVWSTERVEGGFAITGYSGNDKTITIPDKINGVPVVAIGEGAFRGTQLTSVIIPNSVTTIGARAFKGTQLTSVTIGNSVTTIGEGAFRGTQLTSVIIPNSVTTIGARAFRGTQLTSITIGNSVTTIGYTAFASTQLTSVTIPNSVTSIGTGAFDAEVRIIRE